MIFGLFSSAKKHVKLCGYCEVELSFELPKEPDGSPYEYFDYYLEIARLPCPNCKREQVILLNKQEKLIQVRDLKREEQEDKLDRAIEVIEEEISDLEDKHYEELIDAATFEKTLAKLNKKLESAEAARDKAEEKYEDIRERAVERAERKYGDD